MMAELDEEVSCQVIMKDAKVLIVKSENDIAKLVERAHALAFPLGFTNTLHVAARWQTLPQDGFAQW